MTTFFNYDRYREETTYDYTHDCTAIKEVFSNGSWNYGGITIASSFRSMDWRLMFDMEIENFYYRRALGEIFLNPLDSRTYSERKTPWYGEFKYGSNQEYRYKGKAYNWYQGSAIFPAYLDLDIPNISELRSLVSTEAFARCTSSNASALVSLGELRETKELILKAAKRLPQLGSFLWSKKYLLKEAIDKFGHTNPRPLLKGQWRKFPSLAASLEGLWLQFRYGWRPLYKDVIDLSKATARLGETTPKRQTFRAWSNTIMSDTDTVSTSYSGGVHVWTSSRSSSLILTVRAGVLATPRTMGFKDDFGLTKIPSTIWDLTRLSFVADWFFNTSSWLAAWTPDTYWSVLGSWATHRVELVQIIQGLSWESSLTNFSHAGTFWTGQKKTVLLERHLGDFRGFTPKLNVQLNVARYVDAVALFRGTFFKTMGRLYRFIRLS